MKSIEEMLQTWQTSSSVMHISHHVAAGRYSKYHKRFSSIVSGLSALVASSIFVAALQSNNKVAFMVAAFTSLLVAVLTGVNSSLNLAGRSQSHHQAATGFQGLRREIEEELVRCRLGDPKESYEHIRDRWTKALESAPPLPSDIHDNVKSEINLKHKESGVKSASK